MEGRNKVLIISYSHLQSDPRVGKQIKALYAKYDLYTAGFGMCTSFTPHHIQLHSRHATPVVKLRLLALLILNQFDKIYWALQRYDDFLNISRNHYDLIIANDIDTLPLAVRYKNGVNKKCRIYFDAHEFHPREFDESLLWRITQKPYKEFLCSRYIPQADFITTVSNGIAKEYSKLYGVTPAVTSNASPYVDLTPSTVASPVKLIHHGGAIRERYIELMIEAAGILGPGYSLTLMLVPTDQKYLAFLKQQATRYRNVSFIDPAPQQQLAARLNEFDIGIYLLKPTSFNNQHALPNKIFEFLQGRLCIVVGPSPEMSDLVKRYDLGLVSNAFTPDDFANTISSLSAEQITKYKYNSHRHAATLSADGVMEQIQSFAARLLAAGG